MKFSCSKKNENIDLYKGIIFCLIYGYICSIISKLLVFIIVYFQFNVYILPIILLLISITLPFLLFRIKKNTPIIIFILVYFIKIFINLFGIPYNMDNYALYDDIQMKVLTLVPSYFVSITYLILIVITIYKLKILQHQN